jgi:hypothetical protein
MECLEQQTGINIFMFLTHEHTLHSKLYVSFYYSEQYLTNLKLIKKKIDSPYAELKCIVNRIVYVHILCISDGELRPNLRRYY